MARSYYPVAIIGPLTPDHPFAAIFPDLPGCNSAGNSPEHAYEQACEALTEHVGLLAEDGADIPPPSTLDAARAALDADTEPGDGPIIALMLAAVDLPGRTQRYTITLDPHLVQRIDLVTSNRSAFLADAARAALRRLLQPPGV